MKFGKGNLGFRIGPVEFFWGKNMHARGIAFHNTSGHNNVHYCDLLGIRGYTKQIRIRLFFESWIWLFRSMKRSFR